MLRPRIIPCLLIHNGGLVKTIQFSQHKYVGDPLNAVKIFNEKEVDELFVADIDATVHNLEPNYKLISQLAAECRMPLCYAGGIKTPSQVERIIGLGVEKVAISSAAIDNLELIKEAVKIVGTQSIAVVLDVKKIGLLRQYEVFTHNGRQSTLQNPVDFAMRATQSGAGEIIINSIDRDGTMIGYDHELISQIRQNITAPLTALGGARDLADIKELVSRNGVMGAAAGSIFVFKGKYRAVLIQYPSQVERDSISLNFHG